VIAAGVALVPSAIATVVICCESNVLAFKTDDEEYAEICTSSLPGGIATLKVHVVASFEVEQPFVVDVTENVAEILAAGDDPLTVSTEISTALVPGDM
jgi:hypothetical protein